MVSQFQQCLGNASLLFECATAYSVSKLERFHFDFQYSLGLDERHLSNLLGISVVLFAVRAGWTAYWILTLVLHLKVHEPNGVVKHQP